MACFQGRVLEEPLQQRHDACGGGGGGGGGEDPGGKELRGGDRSYIPSTTFVTSIDCTQFIEDLQLPRS